MKMSKREMQQRILAVEGILKANGLMADQEQADRDEFVVVLDSKEPKPRQLDQTVFDHPYVTEVFKFAAIDVSGRAILFSHKPSANKHSTNWSLGSGVVMPMLDGYDATNWQGSIIEREPKLKQLDQSVFDGQDAKFITAAVNEDGRAFLFTVPASELEHGLGVWYSDYRGDSPRIEGLFDTSNWQNSLVERQDKPELTGSDLCLAMKGRGDFCVPCCVSDASEAHAVETNNYQMVYSATSSGGYSFETRTTNWRYAVPINPRTGEPLTATEAGF